MGIPLVTRSSLNRALLVRIPLPVGLGGLGGGAGDDAGLAGDAGVEGEQILTADLLPCLLLKLKRS